MTTAEPRALPLGRGRRGAGELRDYDYFTRLAYSKAGKSRYTQDSPILADVICHYGLLQDKAKPLDLLLTPDWSKNPGELADELRARLRHSAAPSARGEKDLEPYEIAYNQSVVAVRLTFEELISHVLPMSSWWQDELIALRGRNPVDICTDTRLCKIAREQLVAGLWLEIGEPPQGTRKKRSKKKAAKRRGAKSQAPEGGDDPATWERRHWIIRQDLAWAARLFHIVLCSNLRGKWHEPADDAQKIADFFFDLVTRIAACRQRRKLVEGEGPPRTAWVYSVNRNRPVEAAMFDSVKTTKADAARKTFAVTGKGIRWAVIDTGIDARHAAFRAVDDDGVPHERPFGPGGTDNHTRIKATYDFSEIRSKLSKNQLLGVKAGRLLDWERMEKELELRVAHAEAEYRTPVQAHGTHVAGILAANWRPDLSALDPLGPPPTRRVQKEPMTGLCPEIELYDLRVFKGDTGDEFAVMSALQFVRSLNQRHDKLEVHGVNLSLAMGHEVSNYACGRSPVCEECSRLVGNGVVVVAAAGNEGRSIYLTTQNRKQEGYRTVSIADPGNTEAVITVGATHRREPHTYGVSYFSSRGPTGDGRLKPDLVAPGEKVLSTVPGDGSAREDGTSQAAPHVSGAAALLMSRHTELIGDPVRIKKVLMDTATDLGRERHFQGAGMVDVMRAIQSL